MPFALQVPDATPVRRARRRAAVAMAVALAFAPARPAAASGHGVPFVELSASAEVGPGPIVLRDLARVVDGDPERRRRLESVKLGQVPSDGQVVRLARAAIARWVRARAGRDGATIDWRGAATCEVRRAQEIVAGAAIAERAIAAVRDTMTRRGLRAEVALASAPADLRVPAGGVQLRARALSPDAALARRLSVWVDAVGPSGAALTVPVLVDLSVFGPAAIAVEPMPAGSALDPSRVEIREVEWSGLASPPAELQPGVRLRLRAALAPGAVVTRSQVEPMPLVTRGGAGTLYASHGFVRVERQVEILEDGQAGQTVHIKIPGSAGTVEARVTGPGSMEVAE